MPTRLLSLHRRGHVWLSALAALLLLCIAGRLVDAQLIQIKTLPIADGDQWQFFPSANLGFGGLSIALRDSLADPFENPAKGARVSERAQGIYFGSPTFYSVSKDAGGGRTLPLGGLVHRGSTFGGIALALQEIDNASPAVQQFFPPTVAVLQSDGTQLPPPPTPSRQNRFAFATLGHLFASQGISVGGSAQWSGLNDVDGVDLLYVGSRSVEQHGGAVDVRLGALKEWSDGGALEGILLHNRFSMTHDVTWVDQVWNPNTRTIDNRARLDNNLDRTNTWGLHLGYSRPLSDSGWRIGAIATTNLMSHPKLPDYQISQVMTIPWDPGHSAAYDLGIGAAKVQGLTTFGFDAIYEPIRTHTWGEATDSIIGAIGTIPIGGKTTENHFRFSNAILRTGFDQGFPFDTLHSALRMMHVQFGLDLRSVDYTLDQVDHVTALARRQKESWIEWTKTWGLTLRFADLELHYTGWQTTGTGRPGVGSVPGPGILVAPTTVSTGQNFLAAPTSATSLTNVVVTTHQLSVSIPIR
jgi:hypothetical protein